MFENDTKYDGAAVWAMTCVFTGKVQRKRFLLRKCFFMGAGLLGTVSGLLLLMVFFRLELTERVLCAAALAVCVPALLKGIFLRRFTAWSCRRAMRRSGESLERHFTFSEESYLAAQSGMETVCQYDTLRDAYETESHFVLQLDERACFVLDKDGFLQGTPEGFRAFLERKLEKPVKQAE